MNPYVIIKSIMGQVGARDVTKLSKTASTDPECARLVATVRGAIKIKKSGKLRLLAEQAGGRVKHSLNYENFF